MDDLNPKTFTIELRFVLRPEDDNGLLSRAVVDMASMLAQLAGIEFAGGELRLADGRPSPQKPPRPFPTDPAMAGPMS